jgi:hypothetical protein
MNSNSGSVSVSQEPIKIPINNHRPNIIQSASPVKEILNDNKRTDSKSYNSNLYDDNEEKHHVIKSSSESVVSNKQRPVLQYPRPLSSASSNGIINSDSDGDYRQVKQKQTPSSSPIGSRVSEKSPQRQQQQQQLNLQNAKPRRSVRISSVVSDIENDQHIELIDHSSNPNGSQYDDSWKNNYKIYSNRNNNNNNNGAVAAVVADTNHSQNSYHRVSSASSSIDSNENKDQQTPKVIYSIKIIIL